jgi:Fe-S cluster assembly protein SufD
VDARPQLEIFADDVKCTHGSAVGQLDDASLFYLRSRGIDLRAARALLTTAFVSEVLDALPHPGLRLRAQELASIRLGKVLA